MFQTGLPNGIVWERLPTCHKNGQQNYKEELLHVARIITSCLADAQKFKLKSRGPDFAGDTHTVDTDHSTPLLQTSHIHCR